MGIQKQPGALQERPGRSRSSQELPRDAQEQLRSDQDESLKNQKIEPQDAFGALEVTLNSSNRLAGAKKNLRFPAICQEEGFFPAIRLG